MRKISSSFSKRLTLGAFTLGLIGFTAAIVFPAMQSGTFIAPMLIPVTIGVIVFAFFYRFLHDLVDEVWDDGNALVVKDRGRELRIPLSDIMNVNSSTMSNPPRATVTLRNPTQWGKEIAFIPKRPFTLNPFARNKIIDELIERIDAQRRR